MSGVQNDQKSKPNRLIHEKSPYLLQHAYNPVEWFPWGDEAIELARKSGKPIFLSIGYSTCHWCHVMEHESFENKDIAAFMNEKFINIKVDREERPDLDSIYMAAVQAMTGRGGWPMSVWLTADLKPFYGGTYFPPEDRHGLPGFKTVLQQLAHVWENERTKVNESADHLTATIQKSVQAQVGKDNSLPHVEDVFQKAFNQLAGMYDSDEGGFGRAPKFPMPTYMDFLLHYHSRSGEKKALAMVELTMKKMIQGGIYDQLGGGFARYSTDEKWLVPHFEKMLYDNSQLISILADLFQITKDPFYEQAIGQSLEYIRRDMTHPDGGFYSAEDADSEGEEGKFYLWTLVEIKKVLSDDLANIFIQHYGITANGNFLDPHTQKEGQNILVWSKPVAEKDKDKLMAAEKHLFDLRSRRVRPHLDDKIITGWNGLMISAYVKAGLALNEPDYVDRATKAARFLESRLYNKDGTLFRRWRDGEQKIHAHQTDYALLIQGLLDLFKASGDVHWLKWATKLQEDHNKLFFDPQGHGYFMTVPRTDLLVRMKDDGDNVIPSGNSIAVLNGIRLAKLLDRNDFKTQAEKTLQAFGKLLVEYPAALTSMITGLDFQFRGNLQVIVLGPPGRADTRAMLQKLNSKYLPGSWVIPVDPQTAQAKLANMIPFITNMQMMNDKATAYVCVNYACNRPTNEINEMEKQLEEAR